MKTLTLILLSALITSAQPRVPDKLFTLPGITFSEAQQAEVEKIKAQYGPAILEQQRARSQVFTPEQRRARQEAIRAARDAGKTGAERSPAADEAFSLSAEQKQQFQAQTKARNTSMLEIRKALQALLTDEQRSSSRTRPDRPAPTRPSQRIAPSHADLSYGPHPRNLMDVWIAESDQPSPVLVYIHGGGFRAGGKNMDPQMLKACLDSGISVVALTYRFSQDAIAPACFYDCARAIQFIRHHAAAWTIDGTRMVSSGGSAGAGLSLWLGFHDDLADPKQEDPVLRRSSRLSGMAVYNGQTSYDPRVIRDLFPGTDTYKHSALAQLFGVDLDQVDDLPKEKYALFDLVSALPHLSKDDPPVQLYYGSAKDARVTNQGIGIHHPTFGFTLKEKMDALGISCEVFTRMGKNHPDHLKHTLQFLKKQFDLKD